MKPCILALCLLCGLGTAARAQEGLIGINTVNPKGVLHIDGAGNNPASGAVPAAAATDDVLIDASGRLGIGHLSPSVKIDILSSTPGAIRIQDTTEGEGKLLLSDDYGTGRWTPLAIGSWLAALYDGPKLAYSTAQSIRTFTGYAESVFISTGLGSVNKAAGSITVPSEPGRYRVTLSIYWSANSSNSRTAPYTTRAILYNGSAELAAFDFWGGALDSGTQDHGVQPTFVSILNLSGGEVLTVATDERSNRANSAQAVLFMVELLL
jgi:hypothetical protein